MVLSLISVIISLIYGELCLVLLKKNPAGVNLAAGPITELVGALRQIALILQ